MGYESLLILPSDEHKELVQIGKAPKASKKLSNRGCEHCPSNRKKGINKVFGRVKGRSIFVWGMAPGREENRERKEFVGASGKFLWAELSKVGIRRKDCDVQNIMRCLPADKEDGDLIMRDPSKEELYCCSTYTDDALAKSKAQVHIVLGEKAGKQLLGKEYKKTRKVFWSEKLKAKVYCLYHPSYFVRNVHSVSAIQEFRKNLEAVASDVKIRGGSLTRYSYLEKQDYEAITTVKAARKVRKQIRLAATKGIRTSVDLEDDVVNGIRQDLCVGFSCKIGTAKVLITGHPKVKKVDGKWEGLPRKVVNKIRAIAKSIIEDSSIEKVLHHGSYDEPQFWQVMHARLKGFNYDTEFAEYLAYPDRRAFGLNAVAAARFPQFGEYKQISMPEAFPKKVSEDMLTKFGVKMDNIESMYKFCKKTGSMRLSQLPLKKLVLYNGVDCDLTKRIEVTTKKKVHLPLVKIYKDASFILSKMEPNGPAFDFEHWTKLKKLYPPKLETVLDKIKQIAGPKYTIKVINKKTGEKEKKVLWDISEGKDFNPSSPPQVSALIYKKLQIASDEEKTDKRGKTSKPGTGKKVLEILQLKHPIARLLTEYRRLSKMVSTYLNSYEECAKNNGGLLRTTWWLTGTRTGRMSSGGGRGDEKGNTKVINLQNIHGDENLKNQIVADKDWRKLYVAIRKAVKKSIGTAELNSIEKVNAKIAKLPSFGFKKKTKKFKDELEACQNKLIARLTKSLRFKRLTKKILAGVLGAIFVVLGFDQGQVEVRMMAQASGDKNLIKDCKSPDIHSLVGHAMTGWSVHKIRHDKKTRTLTKNIHFGILFGLVPEGLFDFIKAKDPETDLTLPRVKELYDNYFRRYAGVRRFMLKMRAFVEEHGYVENMFGFVRPLNTHSQSSNEDDFEGESGGAFWGNQAINTPIQGAAHCLMFMAMAIMKRKAKKYKKLIPTLEVHDYLGFKTPIRDIFKMFKLGKYLLEKEPLKLIKKEYPKIKWKIPLAVDGNVGFRYGDAVEAEGKQMHEVLANMFCETFTKESKLDYDLKMVA